MELGLYCDVELKDQKIYIDSIVIMGDLDQHIVPWVPNTVTEFPMDVIKEKIANGEKNIHFDVSAVIPVPTELLELIKGTDIVLSYTVLDAVGVPLYRWSLVGSELTDVTAFYPSVTLEKGAVVENALTKSFTVADGAVAGAYLSVYVREDFPSFAKLYLYDAEAKMLLRQGDQVHEAGWFTVSLAEDGSYLLADDKIESYTEPTDPEETKPAGSTPQTGDKLLNLAVLLMLTSAAVTGVMLRKRKEQ
jgi:LPXTG-motif cell wall-anchored protein